MSALFFQVRRRRGASKIGYAILLGVISLGTVGAIAATGDSIRHLFNTVENQAVGPAGEVAESGKAQVRIAGATASEDA
ncbi:Flp family type IVb pilin, partial [Rhodovibrio sodomensis]|uniref:Flp family type IVb pilin n=1 Tax=Rhodovibrio sodomensis TaxID=1088 RepID=UPI00190871E6